MRSFHEIASEYCNWIERTSTVADLSAWLPRILAELVHAAFCLSTDDLPDDFGEDCQSRSYNEVRAALPSLPFQYYREVFDALDLDFDEAVVGDLYDDLADIYSEMANGLYIHTHTSPRDAELYWVWSFRNHWGEHATSALRAFYCALRHDPMTPPE